MKLRKLDISRNEKLKDEDLKHLYGMKTLEAIRIHNCQNLTANGIAKLSSALPKCVILTEKGAITELIDTIFVTEKSYD